jgi:hypothetical protein
MWTAFAGNQLIQTGAPPDVATAAKKVVDDSAAPAVLVFDENSRVVDIDYRGTDADVVARLGITEPDGDETSPYRESLPPRGRGRPRLGVVAREVTLLPRHWEWLATQPGGASAAVRRLVDAARQAHGEKDRRRQAQEVAYRFMSAMAGDAPDFEEATRALFAGNATSFNAHTEAWPRDVRDHARTLAAQVFGAASAVNSPGL